MREHKYLEFKSSITNTFLKTVSAYSNFGDEKILFGVNDDGSILYFEELPCGTDNLVFKELSTKLMEKLDLSIVSEDVLRTLGLFTKDRKYNNAAALLSDENSFYGIDMARFGNTINEIMDRETIAEISILKQYDEAVSMIKRYYQYEEISGMERKKVDLIPETAYREALANAFIHRDWSINSHIRVFMFSDRIEIKSPGGLPKGITVEEYINGDISCLRNPILGNVFFRMRYIEMFGTGITRIRLAYRNAKMKPRFEITDNTISVILPVLTSNYNVTSAEAKIISILEKGEQLSSSEIAKRAGYTKSKTLRILDSLKDKGYIKVIGNGRGTKYSLL